MYGTDIKEIRLFLYLHLVVTVCNKGLIDEQVQYSAIEGLEFFFHIFYILYIKLILNLSQCWMQCLRHLCFSVFKLVSVWEMTVSSENYIYLEKYMDKNNEMKKKSLGYFCICTLS